MNERTDRRPHLITTAPLVPLPAVSRNPHNLGDQAEGNQVSHWRVVDRSSNAVISGDLAEVDAPVRCLNEGFKKFELALMPEQTRRRPPLVAWSQVPHSDII
jgi:hypothetical protein